MGGEAIDVQPLQNAWLIVNGIVLTGQCGMASD